MDIGSIVVRKSHGKDIAFKIIEIEDDGSGKLKYILKGINIRIEADSDEDDLEEISRDDYGETDKIFNKKVNSTLKKVILDRGDRRQQSAALRAIENGSRKEKKKIKEKADEMAFGRPGRILHIDGDPSYLEICLKTYKELELEAVGRVVAEKNQPSVILDLVREVNPDIVVITGHDGLSKSAKDYMDLGSYRNSRYFVECVSLLRHYNSNYDDLIIFAGACQSNYEALLDAGANFASSPERVLIHCLDPVLLCEKVAYTNITEVVDIEDAIENTITGIRGIGGLQTRGKYRRGYPKSHFI